MPSTCSLQEYCRCNTEDINNNIVEFKEAVQVANVELDNKIVGCGKDLERCRADFAANLEKSFTELDEVVQSLATGDHRSVVSHFYLYGLLGHEPLKFKI